MSLAPAADGPGPLPSSVRERLKALRSKRWFTVAAGGAGIVIAAILPPTLFGSTSKELDVAIYAVTYVMFALGLNIVVGFAGLLDLGYVAFYAVGAYSVGWFASDHFSKINGGHPINVGATTAATAGIHLNFVIILIAAMVLAGVAGAIIGFPTLRLRGDYIAIVTLAFGEIAARVAINGDAVSVGGYRLTDGPTAIAPIDSLQVPLLGAFNSATDIRPFYLTGIVLAVLMLLVNFSLRESRLGRAWIAIREDEVAAASMGVPLVKTKLLAYGTGAAMGGAAGAFLGFYVPAIDANQFQFYFSILILSMVILGGLGSIWGVVLGAVALAVIDRYLLQSALTNVPSKIGIHISTSELEFGIFGFLLVIMMILRPEGLFPERRRRVELTEGAGTDENLFEARG